MPKPAYMRIPFFLLLCVLSMPIRSHALEVSPGADIADVIRAMKDAHYPETFLAMGSSDPDAMLEMWAVDQGVLIVSHSKTTHKVKAVSYYFSDERPLKFRKTFDLGVVRFDTDTGRMEIETKKPTK